MEQPRRWETARNVLCVRLDALGDVLMTGPAMRAVRAAAPGRRLTLLTSPAGAAAAALMPEIDDVVTYEAPWMKASPAYAGGAPDEAMIRRLRSRAFDAAIVFTVYTQSPLPAALFCRLADVPLVAAHCRENPYHLLSDWVPESEPEPTVRHEVARQLRLVAALGCPRPADDRIALAVPREARSAARVALARRGLDPAGAWVAIHAGATAASRRYPPDRFAAVGRALARRGIRSVLVGGPDDGPAADAIRAAIGPAAVSVTGTTRLPDLAGLLALAPVLIANNSGPVHVAAGVGTPVVVLYALTNPQHTPWRVPHRVLFYDVSCRWCYQSVCPQGHHDCLQRVPSDAVVEAACALLATRRRAIPAPAALEAAG